MSAPLENAFRMILATDSEMKDLGVVILKRERKTSIELFDQLVSFMKKNSEYKALINEFMLRTNKSKKAFAYFILKDYFSNAYVVPNNCLENAINSLSDEDDAF